MFKIVSTDTVNGVLVHTAELEDRSLTPITIDEASILARDLLIFHICIALKYTKDELTPLRCICKSTRYDGDDIIHSSQYYPQEVGRLIEHTVTEHTDSNKITVNTFIPKAHITFLSMIGEEHIEESMQIIF